MVAPKFCGYFSMWLPKLSFYLAQSVGDSAQETAEQAKDLLTEITLMKIVEATIIVVVAFALTKLLDRVLFWVSEKIAKEWRLRVKQFVPFVRMLVLTTALVLLLNRFLNLSQQNVLAITGTVALALGFAFKDYVSSIIAGLLGLFEAPYQIGDRIKIGENYGEVMSYGLRGLRLKTPNDDIVSIPHNKIWTEAISNANMGSLEAQVTTSFYLEHSANSEQVRNILYRIAQTSRYTQLKLPIAVIIEEEIWGTLFKLKAYPIDARNEFDYKTDLTLRAKTKFRECGFSYPSVGGMDVREADS